MVVPERQIAREVAANLARSTVFEVQDRGLTERSAIALVDHPNIAIAGPRLFIAGTMTRSTFRSVAGFASFQVPVAER